MGKQSGAHIVWDWNGTLFHDNEAVVGATNAAFAVMGLEPITLERGLLQEVTDIAQKYAERCMRDKIPCQSLWRADLAVAGAGGDGSGGAQARVGGAGGQ